MVSSLFIFHIKGVLEQGKCLPTLEISSPSGRGRGGSQFFQHQEGLRCQGTTNSENNKRHNSTGDSSPSYQCNSTLPAFPGEDQDILSHKKVYPSWALSEFLANHHGYSKLVVLPALCWSGLFWGRCVSFGSSDNSNQL